MCLFIFFFFSQILTNEGLPNCTDRKKAGFYMPSNEKYSRQKKMILNVKNILKRFYVKSFYIYVSSALSCCCLIKTYTFDIERFPNGAVFNKGNNIMRSHV